MKILKNRIKIGATEPFNILHITDSHIAVADERDDYKKQELAKAGEKYYGRYSQKGTLALYYEAVKYGRENCDRIICTGDMFDLNSQKAFDMLKEEVDENNLIFAVGNHEYRIYGREEREDFFYKMKSYTQIQNCISRNIDFSATIINGVNFIAVDNAHYYFTKTQLELLKVECEKHFPIVLCMHIPLYHKEYFEKVQNGDTSKTAHICGAPDEVIRDYEEYRFNQQRMNADTKEFIDFVMQSPDIKLIIAGHTHESYECQFDNGLIQLMTDGTFNEIAREIEFV